VARHRRRWRVWQRYMDAASFVFLDETGASTTMVRHSGWGPKGERLVDAAPHGHWRTTTFVAGLRASGIIAPFVLDGPMTGEAFRAYVEQVLAPELEPGDAVVMDNLSPHKVAGVKEAIRAAGASVLYLPSFYGAFGVKLCMMSRSFFFERCRAFLSRGQPRSRPHVRWYWL
jgi:DDE superfamily endonuclease